jgi:cyclase
VTLSETALPAGAAAPAPRTRALPNLRLIARLDVKGPNLIKGIHLEGLRVLGDPGAFARRYYEVGVDELIYMDAVASLYGRNQLTEIVRRTAADAFIPLTVGGGIRSIEDVQALLRVGADKVAINTAAVRRPALAREVARRFGSQCLVLSIEAKQTAPDRWEAYTDNGREPTGLDVIEWAEQGVALGAGEVMLTSVDREGTGRGMDLSLLRAVSDRLPVPVIASGGVGTVSHVLDAAVQGGADAVAIAGALHYGRLAFADLREAAAAAGLGRGRG